MSLKTFKWDAGQQRALFLISFSTVRRQVISRRPLLHFPYGVQYKAVFVMEVFVIFFSMKIWSIQQPLSLLKPACSSRSLRSTASERRFMMSCVRILLGVDNNVMPRHLLHSDRIPYFGILMIIHRFLHQGFFFCLVWCWKVIARCLRWSQRLSWTAQHWGGLAKFLEVFLENLWPQ